MVDASDLKSDWGQTQCRFKSGPGQIKNHSKGWFFIENFFAKSYHYLKNED